MLIKIIMIVINNYYNKVNINNMNNSSKYNNHKK